MYRLTLYILVTYILLTVIFSFFKILPYNPFSIITNFFIAVTACYVSSLLFSKIFKAVTNTESVYITAFILNLLIHPEFPYNALFLILACIIAMGSKYVLVIHKKHVFNPAAIAIVIIGSISADHVATWWIGSPWMFLPVLIGGILIVRKTQKEKMVLTFLGSYLLLMALSILIRGGSASEILTSWQSVLIAGSLLFFSTIMLTEPSTSPRTHKLQMYYVFFVSALFASSLFFVNPIPITVEIALVLGNIFTFIVSPKYRFSLSLIESKKLSSSLYAFSFKKPKGFTFNPGQYMEWTLPHKKADQRGNRRYFSLASSPTENNILIAMRYYTPPSSYKKHLIELKPGGKITATNLSGDFTLPKDLSKPIAFIAGGIGITPFRSMVKYIVDKKLRCNIVLIYLIKAKGDEIFMDVFKEAGQYGVKTTVIQTEYSHTYLDADSIKKNVPDYKDRSFYISGPQPMVRGIKDMLRRAGLKKIKTDFFPGYS